MLLTFCATVQSSIRSGATLVLADEETSIPIPLSPLLVPNESNYAGSFGRLAV
ncbi:MAG TPA: hypothetical protein VLJ11_04080 [Bryobacteraceae bacterium]|nr:hypothetical protein [Bryobacteraceae bacterium]